MAQYITALSKYFITIFMMLYTFECFLVFRYKNEKARKGVYIRQMILTILMHFSCFLSICLKSGNVKFLFFYAVFQIVILAVMAIVPMIYPRINRLIINNVCMLLSIGLVMLARLDFSKAIKQLVIAAVSFAVAVFIPYVMLKIKQFPNKPLFYATTGIVLLGLVYMSGSISNGSKLAVSVLGLSFQASEFVKILFVFFVAGALAHSTSIWNMMYISVIAALHVLLLVMSRDLGAALIFFVVYVILIFIASRNYFYLLLGSGAGVVAAMLAYRMFRHVQIRVQAFIDPFSVIDNEGYQVTQSLFAISSGNWFGLGLFEGTPETIPYVETDFIFSAIAEEMGVVFSICLILICLSCFMMFINIAMRFKDSFYKYISIGLGITYIFQVFLTVGGGVKFIPLTGVTLPLVSYGGSSVMATIFTFFIIEGLYVVRSKYEKAALESEIELSEFDDDIKIADKPGKEKRKKREKKDNFFTKQTNVILAVSYVFIAAFMALSVFVCYYVATYEEEYINNSYNPRQEVLIKKNVRGTIYSRNMEVLAQTQNVNGEEIRYYPFANIFAHVVGYSTNGRAGIEGQTNYYLINSNQPMPEKIAADISLDKYLGDSVITTLDTGLQKTAYTAIGSYNGAVVVSDPRTGEILAMVSKPDYNPNEIEDIWNDLINDKDSSVLLNRATQGLYPPGSCFKIVTLLEYVRENPDTFNNYHFSCSGELNTPEGRITCYNHEVHGSVNLTKSLAVSCNSSFGNIGLTLDRQEFQDTLDSLLFNSDLPLTMNYAKSGCKVNNLLMDDITMVRTAFGQGSTLITPIHLNLITCAIANDGMLMKPYLIDKVVNSNFNTVKDFEDSVEYKRLMSADEANIVTDMMAEVVRSGTGRKLKNSMYTVAGKTGSAEYSDYTGATHSWFTGFAPVDDPQIAVTIILEDAGTSGLHAVPMAKKIFDEYFRRFDTSEYEGE
ncbi:MAG: FtsW/RodA/SpoVE family cell cycle protein [Lachnospiraceae bacterium]|nr:FtsW/RodA/SpoVE family cell cycle protein [Lachnospiraceae bacterium]